MPLSAHLSELPNYILGAFTYFRWNLEWQSSDAHFLPIFGSQWVPSLPRVRPTAILKVSSWRCLRFLQQRPPALGRGFLFRKSSVALFAALLALGANRCGTLVFLARFSF